MTLRSWLVDRFLRAEVDQRIRLALPVRDDAPGYREATTPPLQQPWADVRSLIEAANHLGAWSSAALRLAQYDQTVLEARAKAITPHRRNSIARSAAMSG